MSLDPGRVSGEDNGLLKGEQDAVARRIRLLLHCNDTVDHRHNAIAELQIDLSNTSKRRRRAAYLFVNDGLRRSASMELATRRWFPLTLIGYPYTDIP